MFLQHHSKCCCHNQLLLWSVWWGYGPAFPAAFDTIIWSQLLKLLTVYFSAFILLWSSCSSSCFRHFSHSTFPLNAPCPGQCLLFCVCVALASPCLSKPSPGADCELLTVLGGKSWIALACASTVPRFPAYHIHRNCASTSISWFLSLFGNAGSIFYHMFYMLFRVSTLS